MTNVFNGTNIYKMNVYAERIQRHKHLQVECLCGTYSTAYKHLS